MDRNSWLAERRAAVEVDYTRDAPSHEIDIYPISEAHREFVARVVDACPPDGVVLDIPCGTGRYFELVVAQGRRVVGADQSAGMVEQARARVWPSQWSRPGSRSWPTSRRSTACSASTPWNTSRRRTGRGSCTTSAGRAGDGGLVYLSLEVLADQQAHLDRALAEALAQGAPAVRGEDVGEDTGGYHFYPADEQIMEWLEAARMRIVEDATDMTYGEWGYRHLLLRSRRNGRAFNLVRTV